MAENLIDALKSQLSGAVVDQVSKHLGLDSAKTGSAIGTTAATLLAALTQKATLPGGADQILGLIRNQAPAAGAPDSLSQLPDILSSPEKRGNLEKKGGDLVSQILGPNLGAVLGALGGVLGLGKAVITPLMGMIAPLLLSVISKQVLSRGMNAQGLTDLLTSQTGFLKGALPADLTKSLGINSLADLGSQAVGAAHDATRKAAEYGTGAAKAATHAASHTVKTAVEETSGFPGWLLPLLGLLALGLLGFLLFRSMGTEEVKPVENAAPVVTETHKAAVKAEAPVEAVKPAMPVETTTAAPAVVEELDIVGTALKAGSFKTLADLLGKAGLVEALQGPGPFTVFAPTDEAFAKIPAATLADLTKPENKDKLIEILKYHVIEGAVPAATAVGLDGKEVKTLSGGFAPIVVKDGKVTIGGATVTGADVKTKNGIIHIIDSVLLPPAK